MGVSSAVVEGMERHAVTLAAERMSFERSILLQRIMLAAVVWTSGITAKTVQIGGVAGGR